MSEMKEGSVNKKSLFKSNILETNHNYIINFLNKKLKKQYNEIN